LQPFERGRSALLAAPLAVGSGVQAVLELFDRLGGFRDEDRRSAAAAAEIGAELLRQALAERVARRTLFDAVAAALEATQQLTTADSPPAAPAIETPAPATVLDRLRADLESARFPGVGGDATLRLAEAVRELAVCHGAPAVEYCIGMVQGLREMLEAINR
jgi:hypothetical protein